MTAATAIATAYPSMAPFAGELAQAAAAIGIDASWLANVMNFESGGNPQARNKYSSATGLIQFMPSTAARLGTTTDALYAMTGAQQMPYVVKYFAPYKGKLHSQEDVYMAVFYPAYIGMPDAQFPASVTAVNPGIFTPRDYARMANARAKIRDLIGVTGETTVRYGAALLQWAIIGVVGYYGYRYGKKWLLTHTPR
jgi:hypothetical protein